MDLKITKTCACPRGSYNPLQSIQTTVTNAGITQGSWCSQTEDSQEVIAEHATLSQVLKCGAPAAGEMTRWTKVLIAHPADPGSILSTHITAHSHLKL